MFNVFSVNYSPYLGVKSLALIAAEKKRKHYPVDYVKNKRLKPSFVLEKITVSDDGQELERNNQVDCSSSAPSTPNIGSHLPLCDMPLRDLPLPDMPQAEMPLPDLSLPDMPLINSASAASAAPATSLTPSLPTALVAPASASTASAATIPPTTISTPHQLEMKLEISRRANRLLSEQLGTTIISSSGSDTDGISDDETERKPFDIEQNDSLFAATYTYKTNVSWILFQQFYPFLFHSILLYYSSFNIGNYFHNILCIRACMCTFSCRHHNCHHQTI